jgi:translation initiation factor IF-2
MAQEPERQANEPVAVTKLMIDRPSDFKFHVAYLAYSHSWDKTASQETKTKLNEIISSLSNQEIDYSTFYEKWVNAQEIFPNIMLGPEIL